MISALDANPLIDVRNGHPVFGPLSFNALMNAREGGLLVISDVVYAEVCAIFANQHQCDQFLDSLNIKREPLTPLSSYIASRSWVSYLRSGGKRTRILPDFLIAAHASNQADHSSPATAASTAATSPNSRSSTRPTPEPRSAYLSGLSAVNAEQQGFITG